MSPWKDAATLVLSTLHDVKSQIRVGFQGFAYSPCTAPNENIQPSYTISPPTNPDENIQPPYTILNMSQPQMVVLSDKEVSRMLAGEAMHNQAFRDQLSCSDGAKTEAINQAIETFRVQLANWAEVKQPYRYVRDWDLNRYLRSKINARVLLSKSKRSKNQDESRAETAVGRDREWGWVVSHLVCLAVSPSHV